MILTLQDIRRAFDDLESGTKSREEVADLASEAMRANDTGQLRMEPIAEAPRIWKSISYLCGVDLKQNPESYLHCVEDFIEFRTSIGITSLPTPDSPPQARRG